MSCRAGSRACLIQAIAGHITAENLIVTAVDLSSITKRFGSLAAVDGVSVSIRSREFVAILGASGCGKTTMLRLLAGLERADAGTISFNGKVVSSPDIHVPPETRDVGVVFQSYALWPHMTVAENAGYPLRVKGLPRADQAQRTRAALESVELAELSERKPHALSGGQQQRVALARCLTARPGLVLMDEPLANLDMHLRERMLAEFRAFHARAEATIVYITHDQAEAMTIADRIAVMDQGRILQIASPEELYRKPANLTVARFVGVSSMLEGVVERATSNQRALVSVLGRSIEASIGQIAEAGDAVTLVVRPEEASIRADGMPALVLRSAYLGGRYSVDVEIAGERLKLYADRRTVPGETIPIAIQSGFAIATGQRVSDQGSMPAGKRFAVA
jgi:iron(III) transport system ATP-binding protein